MVIDKEGNMRVLFVLPRQYNCYGTGEITKPRTPHLGIAYLSAYLKKQGHEVDLYDCAIEKNQGSLFEGVLRNYDIVGVSLCSLKIASSYTFVNKIVSYLKRHVDRKIPVVLGGPHVTISGKEALFSTDADFAISGEGEITLSELLKNLQNGGNFKQIDGLMWRDKSGLIVENSVREFIKDMDALPLPDYSIFKLDRYISFELNELPISTSRGCPFGCVFCAVNIVTGKVFRPRSPENILKEIIANYKNGIRNFYVTDDAFNLDIRRAEEICDLIIKNGLNIKFVFQNGLRVDCLTPTLVNKLKKVGCATIVLSAETGNEDVLKVIKKKITIEQFKFAIDVVDRADINFIVNFIIGHPTETYDKAMDSIRLAREIYKKKNCVNIIFLNLIPFPSTELFEWVEKNERWLLPKEKYLDTSMLDTLPVFENNGFTKEEKSFLLKKGNEIHRACLLKFIFGKYIGFFVRLITSIEVIKRLSTGFAFNSKAGGRSFHSRYLRKLYSV